MRWHTLLFRLLIAGLLLPAVFLTALRLIGPEQGLLVRLTSFAPWALPLYVLGLFLVLAKLVLPGLESTRPWFVVALVGAVGLGLHGWWVSPQFVGDAPDAGEDKRTIQVMTANLLRGEADSAEVIRNAALERVDLLVLQEVTPEALRDLERFGIDEAFPFRAGEPAEGVRGTMAFATSRLRAVERLDTSFGSWAMNLVTTQGEVRLYAVHTRPPLGDAQGWADDLDAIADAAEEDRELDLVVGDLNATPDHAPFRRLADEADLRTAAERANSGWQPTWPSHGEKKVLGLPLPVSVQIDHVLVGRSMTAEGTRTLEIDGTDHRALVADVAFR